MQSSDLPAELERVTGWAAEYYRVLVVALDAIQHALSYHQPEHVWKNLEAARDEIVEVLGEHPQALHNDGTGDER